ncbi:MAG TPA: aminotransferase class IV [Paludibaculum sp.]
MIRPQFLHNGRVRQADEYALRAGQVGLFTGWGVFSTVKISGGLLFAFDRHWARMRRDADLLRVPFPWAAAELESVLMTLVAANQEQEATLRVLVTRNGGTMWAGPEQKQDSDLIAFTAPRSVWGASARLGVIPNARHAASLFAGAKTTSWAMNLVWYEEAHVRGQDEVVLLNERGEVSECTSANIFAVFGDLAVTPPLASGCLPGVTRELLLEAVRVPGIQVAERVLTLDDLERADSVFITSTTRDLLPVAAIEGLSIHGEKRVRDLLAEAFSRYEVEYLRRAAARDSRRRADL